MAYLYYQPIELDEHMLFAAEIVELYIRRLTYAGIHLTGKDIHSMIKKYHTKHGIIVPKLYFNTQRGMTRVYAKEFYIPTMEELLNNKEGDPNGIQNTRSKETNV